MLRVPDVGWVAVTWYTSIIVRVRGVVWIMVIVVGRVVLVHRVVATTSVVGRRSMLLLMMMRVVETLLRGMRRWKHMVMYLVVGGRVVAAMKGRLCLLFWKLFFRHLNEVFA